MGVIQHGIYRPFPGEPAVPHPQELATNEEPKEERTMGICKVEGCNKRSVAQGLCMSHYAKARASGEIQIKQIHPKRTNPETAAQEAQKAIPQAEAPSVETKGSEPKQAPLPGDLYLVARIPLEQIRVMTVEQLRDMCRCGHA